MTVSFVCVIFTYDLEYTFFGIGIDGTGYVEDGREIFDEDIEEVQDKRAGPSSSKEPKGAKKRLRDINAPVNEKSNIKKMFSNVAAQKQKEVYLVLKYTLF